jgi:hypothetical protein
MAQKSNEKMVRIEITPSASEYRQLCRDLGELRRRGAETNTAAIVEAVRAAASARKIASSKTLKSSRGTRQRPPVQQELEVPDARQR